MIEIITVFIVLGLLSTSLFLGEVFFEFLYDIFPAFQRYIDRKCEELPDWDSED